jgi:hypothetical protein
MQSCQLQHTDVARSLARLSSFPLFSPAAFPTAQAITIRDNLVIVTVDFYYLHPFPSHLRYFLNFIILHIFLFYHYRYHISNFPHNIRRMIAPASDCPHFLYSFFKSSFRFLLNGTVCRDAVMIFHSPPQCSGSTILVPAFRIRLVYNCTYFHLISLPLLHFSC